MGTLGILGDGSKEFDGNVALFDMHAALQWVKEYIKFFGGDPRQIKVIGHGTGAASAMYLSSSPMGRSYITGVVAMSGSSMTQFSYDDNATTTTTEIGNAHECPHKNEIELLNCLRNKPASEIIQKDSKLQIDRLMERNIIKSMNGMLGVAPTIETADDRRGLPGLITKKPEAALKDEQEMKIPLLIGVTSSETANGINANEITKFFKSGEEFLKAAAGTLTLGGLLNAPQQMTSLIGALGLPTLNDYLKIPAGLNPEKILEKFVETTTDVFFNVPTVLTAELWGKVSSAFFYQFDHISDAPSSGKKFLKPLPLVSKGEKKASSHGNELGFIFDIYDVSGNRIADTELKSDRDKQVRRNFIEMITQFAYLNASQSELKLFGTTLPSFRAHASNFLKLSEKISIDKDFRFCQLSLLGTPLKSAQKISCEFLSEGLKKIPMVPNPKDITGMLGGGKFGLGGK